MNERRAARHPSARVIERGVSAAMVWVIMLASTALPAEGFPQKLSNNGQLDFTYGANVQTAGGAATTAKPESKLFYTGDGVIEPIRWWAVLGTSGPNPSAGVWLFELVGHAWVARVNLPGADPWAKADALFDGSTVFVSTRDNAGSVSGNPRESDLYKIPYLGNGSFGAATGPFMITTDAAEALTIAEDSAGRIWTTYEQGEQIRVGFTAPGGSSFTFIQVSQTHVNADDISSVVAFDDRIGVFWSDQVARKDFFAWRADADPVSANWTIETAYGGGVGGCPTASSALCADDHMNIKAYGGTIYVAVKTSLGDGANPSGADPLITLLRRNTGGSWSSFPVSTVSQDATRPITVLSPDQDAIWVWASRAGDVDVWESSLTSPGFTSTAFVPWIDNGSTTNDATSTKQVTTGASGTIVEASVSGKTQYWHNEFLPTVSVPPSITGFAPASGSVGTAVTISGSGFSGATDVRFNGASVGAGNFTVDSDGQIAAAVPAGATTGPISVDTPGGTATSPTSFTVEEASVLTFSPTGDAYVQQSLPDGTAGSASTIKVDNSPVQQGLIRFDVSGVGTNPIVNVKLRLLCKNGAGRGGNFFSSDGGWDEHAVTWNTAPPAGALIGSLGKVAAGNWYELDLTSFVTADGTYSVRISTPLANNAVYSSKEGTAAPQLVVTTADVP